MQDRDNAKAILIPQEMHTRLKIESIKQQRPLFEISEEAIRNYIDALDKEA